MSTPSADADPGAGRGGHYFSDVPTARSRPATVRLDLVDRSLELGTDRGVFSPDRVDPGTKLLLMELLEVDAPDHDGAVVVDLGCGYGPIALTLAARHPSARVLGVDVNPRARELCSSNARRLGLDVEVLAPEEVPEGLEVDHLVSNPPIRVGKAAMHEMLSTWLDRLSPSGVAHLVVAKHKGADSLATWLGGRGHDVERLRSRQGYRVLRVPARRVSES